MAQSVPSESLNLEQYRWGNRLILLFAPSSENAVLKAQLERLVSHEEELEDRDLKIFQLFEASGLLEGQELSEEGVRAVRAQFKAPLDSFLFVLIGKDGGVKRRSAEFISVEDLFAQIDSMPMRQREMREGD